MDKKTLIQLAEVWRDHKGLKLSTVSTYAARDGKFFDRLIEGADCTIGTAERITKWFSDHWPEDLEWPDDVPRPEVSEPAVGAGK